MSTKMYRKTTCVGCGYSQETNVSYRQDKKQWNAIHTLEYCRSRKAHPAVQSKLVIAFGDGANKMSVVRDSVDL